MLSALRRETFKFVRDVVREFFAAIEVWKGCGVKFKSTSLILAIFIVLMIITLSAWPALTGYDAPSGAGVVLWMISIQLAKRIGKKQGWL